MNLNNLNWVTVFLVALKLFGFINISWWLVLLPTFIWIILLMIVIVITLVLMIANNMTMEEFNKLMENKKNKDDK